LVIIIIIITIIIIIIHPKNFLLFFYFTLVFHFPLNNCPPIFTSLYFSIYSLKKTFSMERKEAQHGG